MILRKISVQNLGSVRCFSHNLSHGLNIIKDQRREELLFAIRLVLGHNTMLPPLILAGADTVIEAAVVFSDTEYTVRALFDERKNGFSLCCRDRCGADATSEYLYLTSRSCEEDEADAFIPEEVQTVPRFLKYANEDLYYPKNGLARATNGFSCVKAFRKYLRSFIENFEPELLREDKEYELVIEKNGTYAARCKLNGRVTQSLSETERMLFKYLCFLRTAEFWDGFEQLRDMHSIKRPMIISGFCEKLDESVRVDGLLQRAASIRKQTILLTNED